ncbi:hypothetical protein ABIA94_009293 [Bradyrhizobium sp. LA7.1]
MRSLTPPSGSLRPPSGMLRMTRQVDPSEHRPIPHDGLGAGRDVPASKSPIWPRCGGSLLGAAARQRSSDRTHRPRRSGCGFGDRGALPGRELFLRRPDEFCPDGAHGDYASSDLQPRLRSVPTPPRSVCPYILGHAAGEERAFVLLVDASSRTKRPVQAKWICLRLSKIDDVRFADEPWIEQDYPGPVQRCVHQVHLDANLVARGTSLG